MVVSKRRKEEGIESREARSGNGKDLRAAAFRNMAFVQWGKKCS